jgi:hypothetical protein
MLHSRIGIVDVISMVFRSPWTLPPLACTEEPGNESDSQRSARRPAQPDSQQP